MLLLQKRALDALTSAQEPFSAMTGFRKSMRTSIIPTETSFSLHIYGPRALTLAQVLFNWLRCPHFYKNLYHPLDIIHTRAQSPDIGSGAGQYNIHGRVHFLQEPHILLT